MAKELFYFSLPAPDLEKSKAFYSKIFGWETQGGSLGGHVGNTTTPCGLSPGTRDTTHTMIYLTTFDLETSLAEVEVAGGTVLKREVFPSVGPCAFCRDNQGFYFAIQEPAEELKDHARNPKKGCKHGDLFFFSIPVKEKAKAQAFYAAVAQWEFDQEGEQGGLGVSNTIGANGGLGIGREGERTSFWFRVTDINDTCRAIKKAGGTAGAIFEAPEGVMSECYDDQGVKVGIVQPAPGY